jgi:hypothetical protein
MHTMAGFMKTLLLFSAFIYIVGLLLFSTLLNDYFIRVFYFLGVYFILLSIGGRMLIAKSDMKKKADFNARYFLARWLKMLLHIIIIILYLLNDRENILTFVLTFMVIYLLYSIFDIYTLNHYLKKKVT